MFRPCIKRTRGFLLARERRQWERSQKTGKKEKKEVK